MRIHVCEEHMRVVRRILANLKEQQPEEPKECLICGNAAEHTLSGQPAPGVRRVEVREAYAFLRGRSVVCVYECTVNGSLHRLRVVVGRTAGGEPRWTCPFCDYKTKFFEKLHRHLDAEVHVYWLWRVRFVVTVPRSILERLREQIFRAGRALAGAACPPITAITKDDILAMIVEKPQIDPESVFGDDSFLEWYFSEVRKCSK